MKKDLKWISSIVIGLVILAVLFLYKSDADYRIGYIDNAIVFNNYPLKKELEVKLNNIKNLRRVQLDSLYLKLQLLSKDIEINKIKEGEKLKGFELLRSEYLLKKEQFDLDNESLTKQYNDQILKQINQYVIDYGQENNYRIIMGAKGDGNIMYADNNLNITSIVSEYVNKKFKGK